MYHDNEGDTPVHQVVEVTQGNEAKKSGTEYDQRGMMRMGRKQELRRQFEMFSITGYAVVLGCSWEFAIINLAVTLTNGGLAGSIYAVLIASCGMIFVQLSFAEVASIAPTSGGQYHWCSECMSTGRLGQGGNPLDWLTRSLVAPKNVQKAVSFLVGVFCILRWQTSLAAVCFAGGQQIADLANLGNSSFHATTWQISLISFAILAFVLVANTILFRNLPLIESCIMALHCLAFLAIVVVLAVMAPRAKASNVFSNFEGNGWPNQGVAFLTALTGPAAYLTIADSAVHLSEEVKDAARVVSRATYITAITNYVLAFGTVVTFVFSLGNCKDVLDSPIGQPYLAIILDATHSKAGTMISAVVILILVTSCAVNGLTTISRQIWSFARDNGPPFSRWLSVVTPGWDIPLNAMLVSMMFTVILNFIAMGSNIAYNMLLTLNVSGLMTSYIICIACILYRRNWGEPLPTSRFSFGKGGNIINIISLLFLALVWTFQFFPPASDPAPADMNWGSAMHGFVVIVAAAYYMLRGRFKYDGPFVNVRRDL